jgi:hypothetical protein
MFIQDGKGDGAMAHVDSSNRLSTCAQTITLREVSAALGNAAYFFATGLVTLTSGNESALLYIRNTDSNRYLIMQNINMSIGVSTGAPGASVIVRLYLNPTGGTLLTGGTAVNAGNANLGSTVPAQATVQVGAEGSTVTSAGSPVNIILRDNVFEQITVVAAMPVGTAAAVSVDPAAGNTSMQVAIQVGAYYIANDF